MKNKKLISSLLSWGFLAIAIIVTGTRAAMTHVLEGPVLVYYLLVTALVVYSLVGILMKIYREYKNS